MAADEIAWDYAPTGINQISGEAFTEEQNVFVQQGPDRIGKVYIKALFREYTDNTFTTLKPIDQRWEHLGTLGPVLKGEVGDTIVVVFKNNARFTFSVHPHGVFYLKDSEGAPYNDGTAEADKADDFVQPGATHVYTWPVPERAGPGPNDGNSIMWMYHSHVDEPTDTNAGLIGAMIIYSKGEMQDNGLPKGVDREFVTMFTVFDENVNPYLDENIQTYAGDPASVDPEDDGFIESNLMHSINGYVYGNLPGLTMKKGENVRWYLMGMGTEVDLHTPHWHGNTVVSEMMRLDVIDLLPATMHTADMTPDNAGIWLFHCHVNDHIIAGMQALYTVEP
jgi:FtsP/CotA-like multicopper oxidase with cupredoxin domain